MHCDGQGRDGSEVRMVCSGAKRRLACLVQGDVGDMSGNRKPGKVLDKKEEHEHVKKPQPDGRQPRTL